LYGTLPDLTLGGDDDMTEDRGRFIPTTSTAQIMADVVKWFGINDHDVNALFPELKNFKETPLKFMKDDNIEA